MPIEIEWEPRSQRYRFTDTKRYANKRQVRALVRRAAASRDAVLDDLDTQLVTGEIELDVWQQRVASELRQLHEWFWLLGIGGYPQIIADNIAALASRVASELDFHAAFTQDIADGNVSEAQFLARSAMYRRATQNTFNIAALESHRREGYTHATRHRTVAHSCPECIEYERRGKVPIADVVAPGTNCSCRSNCKCFVQYERGGNGSRSLSSLGATLTALATSPR